MLPHVRFATFVSVAALLLAPVAIAATSDLESAKKYEADADTLLTKNDLKGAQIQLRNAVRAAPNSAPILLKLAEVDLRLHDLDGAEAQLKAARGNNADPAKLTPLLARLYMSRGKYEDLLSDIPDRQSGTPDARVAALTARANALISLGRIDEARKALETATALLPQNAGPKLAMARIDLSQNQPDSALQLADAALAADPSADGHLVKGEILGLKQDFDKALAEFDAAIKLDPNNPAGYFDRVRIRLAKDDDDGAAADLKSGLRLDSTSIQGNFFQAALLTRKKDYVGADNLLTKIAPAFPSFSRGYYLQAVVKANLRQNEQAEAAVNAFLARNPDDVLGQLLLSDLLIKRGKRDQAIDTLEKLVAREPDNFMALNLLGQSYLRARKPQEAMALLERAAKLKPNDSDLMTSIARTQLAMGQGKEGIAQLEKTVQANPDDRQAAETLMVVYLREKQYDKARTLVEATRAKRPNDPNPATMAAMIEVAQSHLPEAETAYKAAIKKFPDYAPAKLELAYVYQIQNRRDEAQALYQEILAKTPTNVEALQELSNLLDANNQHDAAVALWQKGHKAAQDDVPVAQGLIRALVAKRDLEGSLAIVRDMQLRLPNEPRLYEIRADLQMMRGTPQDAVVSYRKLAEMSPQSPAPLRQLAVALDQMGDRAGAVNAIADARKLGPTDLSLAADEVKILGKRNPADGIAAAKKIGEEFPDQPLAQIMEGDYLTVLKRPDEANAAYQRAFQAHPSLPLVEKLASASVRDRKPEDGLKLLTDWTTAHPTDISAKFDLANYYAGMKKYPEAKAQYEEVLKAQPDHAPSLNELALVYHREGDAKALDYAKKAYAAAPRNPNVTDTIGWIMVHQGDVPGGLKYLQQAQSALPSDPAVQYHVAFALDRSGQKAEAVDMLKKVIASGKSFQEKPEAEMLLSSLSKS